MDTNLVLSGVKMDTNLELSRWITMQKTVKMDNLA